MKTPACINCGLVDEILVHLTKHKRNNISLCTSCYDDYIKGYIALVNCESCAADFITDNDDAPFLCNTCMTFNTNTYSLVDDPLDKMINDIERTMPPRNTVENMCVVRALDIYVDARKNETFLENKDRAFFYYGNLHGLPDNTKLLGTFSVLSRVENKPTKEILYGFASIDRIEEGLSELVAIAKEDGYRAYRALDEDIIEMSLDRPTKHFTAYMAQRTTSLCLSEEDPLAGIPF